MDNREKYRRIMKDIMESDDVIGTAIVRRNSFPFLSQMPDRVDVKSISAVSAAMMCTGEKTSEELSSGKTLMVAVESTRGKFIVINAGNLILATLVRETANIGYILLIIEKACKRIEELNSE